VAKDYKTASVLAEDQVMLFCAACSEAGKQKTLAIMQREPLAPVSTPIRLDAARVAQVDKVYIATRNDNAVSYWLQQKMIARTPVRKVVTLVSGHSPFVETPDALARALLDLG
jgi:hypothetical protein